MAKPPPAVPGKPTCVLALQGGGALGACHIGAYQASAEHGFDPDWFSGISIGAINSDVLAGTPAGRGRGAARGTVAADLLAGGVPADAAAAVGDGSVAGASRMPRAGSSAFAPSPRGGS